MFQSTYTSWIKYTTGCIPPNKILYTTIAFGAITDRGNVSIYIHIMDKIYYRVHTTKEKLIYDHSIWGYN